MLAVARYGTRDLARAAAFYDALAEVLGAGRLFERPDAIGYQGADGGFFVIGRPLAGEPTVGNGTQVGFAATTRAAVDAAHARALALGGTCEGPPGLRGDDPNGFYAAYFRDLDGNKLLVFRYGPPD